MKSIQIHFNKIIIFLVLIIVILSALFLKTYYSNRELEKENASLKDQIDELDFTIEQYESNLDQMGYSFGSPDDLELIHQNLIEYEEEIERLNEQIDDLLFSLSF